MRGHHERRAPGERGDQSRGDEEVRVDDVGALGGERPAGERQVAELPAAARVENGELDLVTASHERPLDLRDEGAEVGRVRPGIHLGDEKDPHKSSVFSTQDEGVDRTRRRNCRGHRFSVGTASRWWSGRPFAGDGRLGR